MSTHNTKNNREKTITVKQYKSLKLTKKLLKAACAKNMGIKNPQ